MKFRFLSSLLLPLALGTSAVACQGDADDVTPGEERHNLAAMQGTIVEIAPSQAMEQSELEAVAQWLEGESKAHMVQVRMKKEEEGHGRLEVEIWGDKALGESLDADLRAAFPALAEAEITLVNLDGPPPGGEGDMLPEDHEEMKDASPEEVKAKIIADMRAKGVEGDIIVDVIDTPDGERRVEVKVEQTKESSPE